MSSVILPIDPQVPDQQFQVELDAVTYTFRFKWNSRGNGWFMDLLDAGENPLLYGRRVVLGWPLLIRFSNFAGFPQGTLEAVDTSGQDLEAGINDLGARVVVMYTPVGG